MNLAACLVFTVVAIGVHEPQPGPCYSEGSSPPQADAKVRGPD